MILGEDCIIISKEDAKKILEATYLLWNKDTIKHLMKVGAFDIINFLRDATKED